MRVKLDRPLAPSVLVLATSLTALVFSHQTLGSNGSETIPSALSVPAVAAVAEAPAASPLATTGPAVLKEAARTAAPAPALFPEGVEGLAPEVLAKALDAVSCARARGVSGRNDLLTVIDYSLPSTEPRLWVLDLAQGEVLFHELVAHGSGTGDNIATRFSNVKDSRQTSLGLFRTAGTYQGGNGYSLKLQGLDEGLNDRAEERHIVIHGAPYVNTDHIRIHGRIGRSWGCPAVPLAKARPVIDTIKGGSFVFSYHARSFASDTAVRHASFSGGAGSCGGTSPTAPTTVTASVTATAVSAVATAVP